MKDKFYLIPIILTILIIGIVIACFISCFGDFTYIDLDGKEDKAEYCTTSYGNMYCMNGGQRIMVKSYKIN